MTKFEDQLFGQLMAEHGHQLRAVERPAPARRRVRRPVWLATGAAVAVAAATAAAMALGSAPAYAAYSVTRHADGTVTISVSRPSGVAGANVTLHGMHARVVVVPVRPGCPAFGSLPHPRPAPHPNVSVKAGVGKNGNRSVTVKVWGKGGIPAGTRWCWRSAAAASRAAPRWGEGHHHRARAPLREPPAPASRWERYQLNQYRLSGPSPGSGPITHQIQRWPPGETGRPSVRAGRAASGPSSGCAGRGPGTIRPGTRTIGP